MIGLSDLKGAWVFIKRTPARSLRVWIIASFVLNICLGWAVYDLMVENRVLHRQMIDSYKEVVADKRDLEDELKRLRKKVEKP